MKIDIYAHIIPKKYGDRLYQHTRMKLPMLEGNPTLANLEDRFQIMDRFDDLAQVLIPSGQPIESVTGAKEATELTQIYNDELAELVSKYPARFPAAVAVIPMNDIEAALRELDRAITELRFRGVFIHTPVNFPAKDTTHPPVTKPIDSPEFMPIYERMAKYNLPIWLHPFREYNVPDYSVETRSKYQIWQVFGWPYETTVAMTRLVFSGILEKYPNLKFITHHCGAMVPFFEQRIAAMYDYSEMRSGRKYKEGLTRSPLEYYHMFYNDTAINGSTPGLMCAYKFFGAKHILFGTDMPYDSQVGYGSTRKTIGSIERMDITAEEKQAIFEANARELLRLPI